MPPIHFSKCCGTILEFGLSHLVVRVSSGSCHSAGIGLSTASTRLDNGLQISRFARTRRTGLLPGTLLSIPFPLLVTFSCFSPTASTRLRAPVEPAGHENQPNRCMGTSGHSRAHWPNRACHRPCGLSSVPHTLMSCACWEQNPAPKRSTRCELHCDERQTFQKTS